MKDECKTDEKKSFNLFKKIGTLFKRFWEFLKRGGIFSATVTFRGWLFLFVMFMIYNAALAGIIWAEFFCLNNTCERICFLFSSILLIFGVGVWLSAPLRVKTRAFNFLGTIYDPPKNAQLEEDSKGSLFLKKHNFSTQSKILIGSLIVAIFISFFPLISLNEGYGILDIIRRTMQTLVVDGGLTELANCADIRFYTIYSASLWTVGAAIVTFNIIILLAKEFSAYMSYWIWHPLSHIFVFSELNDKSITVAESIFFGYYTQTKELHNEEKRNKYCTLYGKGRPRFFFCDAYSNNSEEFSELIARTWRIGAVIMKRDITELNIKRGARGNTFYLIGEDEEENVSQAQKICRPNKKRINKGDLKVHVYASGSGYEKLIDDSLNCIPEAPNSKEDLKTKTTVRRMDEHSRFALDFFWEHGNEFFKSLRRSEDAAPVTIRVAFLGFGDYAVELFKTLCSLGQFPKCRLIIYIFDKDGNAHEKTSKDLEVLLGQKSNIGTQNEDRSAKERMDVKYHDKPYYELYFKPLNVEARSKLDKCCVEVEHPFTHFIVSLGDDARNFGVSTYLCQKLKRQNRTPFIYTILKNGELYSDSIKKIQNEYRNLFSIGNMRDRYAYWTIEQEELERLGSVVHYVYFWNKMIADFHWAIESQIRKLKDKEPVISEKAKELVYNTVYEECEDFCSEIIRLYYAPKSSSEKESESIIVVELEKELYDKEEFSKKINTAYEEQKITETEKDALTTLWNTVREETQSEWKAFLNKIGWDPKSRTILYERAYAEYNRKEYFRRSSKSRVLYERLLFDLGYLEYEEDALNIQNLVPEYNVNGQIWSKAQCKYEKETIPFYCSTYNTLPPDSDIKIKTWYDALPSKDDTKIDGQYFELYNLLQKRWMVFRWSEGYVLLETEEDSGDTSFEDNDPTDHVAKTHRYLKPYVEIFKNPYAKLRHTIPVIYKPTGNDKT